MINPEQFLDTYTRESIDVLRKQYQAIFFYDQNTYNDNDFVLWCIHSFLLDYKFKCLISKLQENA